MNHIQKKHTFSGARDKVFHGLSNYATYPKYIHGVTSTRKEEITDPEASCAIGYELVIIKSFYYVLDMYHQDLEKISWKLTRSNFLTHNSGAWIIKEHNEHFTKVEYNLEIDFKTAIPSFIVKQLTTRTLPMMFQSFQRLIDAQAPSEHSTTSDESSRPQ